MPLVMNTGSHPAAVSMALRKQLVAVIPGFATAPEAVLDEVAGALREEAFPAGAAVVAEGDRGDRLYLIQQGRAEVTTVSAGRTVLLATLEAGDMFGEIALLTPVHRRMATVTAAKSLLTLTLSAEVFERALHAYPEARIDVAAAAETLLAQKFIKQRRAAT